MRKPAITRTIKTKVVTALVVNTDTRETFEKIVRCATLPAKTEKQCAAVQELLAPNEKIAAILSIESETAKYSATIDEYISVAKKID